VEPFVIISSLLPFKCCFLFQNFLTDSVTENSIVKRIASVQMPIVDLNWSGGREEGGLTTMLLFIYHFRFAVIRTDKVDIIFYCHFVCIFLLSPQGGRKEDLIRLWFVVIVFQQSKTGARNYVDGRDCSTIEIQHTRVLNLKFMDATPET